MNILFGHPGGNPNSHHAAWAHLEAGRLEAFCVPWMPTPLQLKLSRKLPGFGAWVQRLDRRCFLPLLHAPRIEGACGETWRMFRRVVIPWLADERLSYEANDWLMETMKCECRRSGVTAVHSYEDCSLWQFEEAKRLGKACIYDMPIGYYPAWERTQAELVRRYADWLPPGGLLSNRFVRPEQKRKEMELADLVLVPSMFVRRTIEQFFEKRVALASYGVDLEFWHPRERRSEDGPLRFIYAGQSSLRKGIPVLLEAWRHAGLKDAVLDLVGSWQFTDARRRDLPRGVTFTGPISAEALRERYQSSDVLVFPSFFEGFGLVILEAMACGLPVIASDATAGPDLLDPSTGRVVPAGDKDALIESLRWFATHRERLPEMKTAARRKAETCTWEHYRRCVSEAVAPFA